MSPYQYTVTYWTETILKKNNKITSCGNRCGGRVTARKTLICEHFFYKSVPCFHWQRILWNWRHSFLKFSVLKQYSPDEYKVTYFLISRRPPDKKTVYLQMMHARGKRIFNTDYKILKRTNISIWSVKRKQPLTPF